MMIKFFIGLAGDYANNNRISLCQLDCLGQLIFSHLRNRVGWRLVDSSFIFFKQPQMACRIYEKIKQQKADLIFKIPCKEFFINICTSSFYLIWSSFWFCLIFDSKEKNWKSEKRFLMNNVNNVVFSFVVGGYFVFVFTLKNQNRKINR